jgi:hypothetical protein
MDATLQNPDPEEVKRTSPAIKIGVAAVVFVLLAALLWYLFGPVSSVKIPARPPAVSQMSPAEREYVKNIQIGNVNVSRAENFLHQEVTTVSGEIYNSGNESVSGLRLAVEFTDDMNQVVLRETRDVNGTPGQPLTPGERRSLEISFEHVPVSWNMQQPALRVVYLQLPNHE